MRRTIGIVIDVGIVGGPTTIAIRGIAGLIRKVAGLGLRDSPPSPVRCWLPLLYAIGSDRRPMELS